MIVFHTFRLDKPAVDAFFQQQMMQLHNSPATAGMPIAITADPGGLFEYPGIAKVYELARGAADDAQIGYLHTKGASKLGDDCVADWREYMMHFFVQGPSACAVTGVNWQEHPWPHFSGNFWWATASHIRRLPPPIQTTDRCYYERWIGSALPVSICCRHSSNVNHYHVRYPKESYVLPG